MNRRRFLITTGGLLAAAPAARLGGQTPAAAPAKTVRTALLEIGYHESGPASGLPVGERTLFPNLVDKRIVEGAGHFVPHEKPEAVATALLDVIAASR